MFIHMNSKSTLVPRVKRQIQTLKRGCRGCRAGAQWREGGESLKPFFLQSSQGMWDPWWIKWCPCANMGNAALCAETWTLNSTITGFPLCGLTEDERWGGLQCLWTPESWTCDGERASLYSIRLHPYYLPREFTWATVTVYTSFQQLPP